MLPDQGKEEGPFSEWTGYYASGEKTEPVVKVHRLYHRNGSDYHRIAGVPLRREPNIATNSARPHTFVIK